MTKLNKMAEIMELNTVRVDYLKITSFKWYSIKKVKKKRKTKRKKNKTKK